MEVSTPDEGVFGWRFKSRQIWYVFNYFGTTSEDTGKWMEPLDSGHQINVEIILNGILTVFEKCSPGGWHISRYWAEYFNLDWPSRKIRPQSIQ